MPKALTSKMGAIWIQPDGPNTQPYFLDCKDLGDITEAEGALELIRCHDPSGAGWKVVGDTQSPPDPVTFDITGLMFKAKDWLERVRCPFSLHILMRDCGRADNFSNYVRGLSMQQVRRTQKTYSNMVMREEDTSSTFGVTLEAWPPLIYVEDLAVDRQTSSGILALNDVIFNVDERCEGDCGDTLELGDDGEVVGDAAAGVADNALTVTGGTTWTAAAANPFAVTENIAACTRFYVGRDTVRYLWGEEGAAAAVQGNVGYSDDGGATWTLVAIGGAAAGLGPTYGGGIYALDENHIWMAGTTGYIWFSDDGGETWATQDAGVVAATDYSQIHFADDLYGLAVTTAGVTAVTSDGGATWAAGGVVGGGTAANLCCQRLDANRAWVGDDAGRLYYSTDGCLTWTQRTGWAGSGAGDVRDLHFVNDLHGFMVHDTVAPLGTILKTINGGYTWNALTTPTNSGLNAIWACDESTAYAVGEAHGGASMILKVSAATI